MTAMQIMNRTSRAQPAIIVALIGRKSPF